MKPESDEVKTQHRLIAPSLHAFITCPFIAFDNIPEPYTDNMNLRIKPITDYY